MPNYLIIASAVLLLSGGRCAQPAPTVHTDVLVTDGKRASPTLTGFNAEYMTDVCFDAEVRDKLENMRLHADCRAVVDSIDPEVLRWPGGITAQYYHFDGPGYGYRAEEVKGTEYAGNPERLQEFLTANFIEVFLEMARGRKVVYVANLLTGSLDENLRAIRYLQEGGAEVIGVELGNEFYFGEMSPEEYLRRAEPYFKALPDMKLAVHMAPDFGAKNQEWNRVVSRADADAVVIHEYNRQVKNFCEKPGSPGFYECAIGRVNEFCGPYLERLIAAYRNKYGAKEVWLTEWNLAPRTPGDIYGSFVQAYHTFVMLNRLQELDLEMALFHNLITGGDMYPVVTRKQETMTINPDYYVHTMLPKGEYLAQEVSGGAIFWMYSNGWAVANPTGSAVSLSDFPAAGQSGFQPKRYRALRTASPADRPVYAEGTLNGTEVPPYSLVVFR